MERKNKDKIISNIKNKYKVDNVYSYSQLKLFDDDSYEYLLKYIKHINPDNEIESVYGICGGIVHDILEQLYNNEIELDDCKKVFKEKFDDAMNDPLVSKFSNDPLKNKTMEERFFNNICNFFDNYTKLPGKVSCEELVDVLLNNGINKAAFMGYVDFMQFNEDGSIQIIDYKTSSMYRKKDIPMYSQQLILYAEAVRRKYHKKYKDIKVGWNFLKYAIAIEKTSMSEELIERKDMNDYPSENYIFKDCVINIDFDESTVVNFINIIVNKVNIIEKLTANYFKTNDDTPFCYQVSSDNIFRLNNFCKYSAKYHRPLREYLEKNNY